MKISGLVLAAVALIWMTSAFTWITTFKYRANEDPITEYTNWIGGLTVGLDWSNCAVLDGMAHGSGGFHFSDSTALLNGTWGNDQTVTATLFRNATVDENDYPEVELRLRSALSPHSCTGYEILYSMWTTIPANSYFCIVRWNGAVGDFTGLACINGNATLAAQMTNGATFKATAIGTTISMYLNGVLLTNVTDATFASGRPGMGFDNGTNFSTAFGFTNFMATDGLHSVTNFAASIPDVQAITYVATNHQDVVFVPPITNTITSKVTITNDIWLIGEGTNASQRSLVSDGMADQVYAIQWMVPPSGTGWLTGFYFTNARSSQDVFQFIDVESGDTATSRIRVYGNVFDRLYKQIGFWYGIYGVFDHNTVISKETGVQPVLGYVKDSTVNFNGVNAYGDGAWTNALALGSEQFMFFESNDFTNAYNLQNMALIDGQAGARFVIRSNSWFGYNIQCHGLEAERERSGCAFEMYGNTNRGGWDSPDTYLYFRGGVGVVWGETIRGNANTANFSMLNNRTADAEAEPFGGADGQNPWDTNSTSNPFVTGTCSSSGTLTMTDNTKTWTANQWAGYILRKTSGTSVSSMTRSGGTVTVNATSHGYTSGQRVSIFQQPYTVSSEQPYEGTFICTVVNANQFTVPCDFTPSSPATATYLTCSNNYFSEITANTTGGQVTFKPSIFENEPSLWLNMTFTAGQTYRINYIEHAMDQIGRRNGSSLDGVTMPTLPAGWNNQVTDPWWSWSNTNLNNNSDVFFNPQSGTIRTNIHFITSNTAKPGYSPYQWPHNLVGPAQSVPGAPQAILVGPFILKGPARVGSL